MGAVKCLKVLLVVARVVAALCTQVRYEARKTT